MENSLTSVQCIYEIYAVRREIPSLKNNTKKTAIIYDLELIEKKKNSCCSCGIFACVKHVKPVEIVG